MPKSKLPDSVETAFANLLESPSLGNARALEQALRSASAERRVFGRINQKASLEANSESDRGIAERLANAFDASLTAARLSAGISSSSKELTPRKAAQRFLSPSKDKCDWRPQDKRVTVGPPSVEFWLEPSDSKVRYKRYHTAEGLCTVLVSDSGIGIEREKMPSTILDLNSDSKLQTFEAIGQFGHGGSSSLAFCESVLVVTQPRVAADTDEFYWTLIVPERSHGESKQELVRYWFSDVDGLPFRGSLKNLPRLKEMLPGTAIWHFGYSRGGWIKAIAGPEQSNPWGRLGRLFFSYPLPFHVRGELARTDTTKGQRLLKGAFFRLLESDAVEYSSGERSEALVLDGTKFGEFHAFFFVLKEGSSIRDYVDPTHPVIGTLNGQNHGEMTKTIISKAGLPELSTSMAIEIRLDDLDVEAQSNVINNSREAFKRTEFTRELEARLLRMLEDDDVLKELEVARQEKKAREASADMSKRLSAFLSDMLSDAKGKPSAAKGGAAPGKSRARAKPLPEVPAADPPNELAFLYTSPLTVPEGSTKLAKFRSDARPPKYSFYGDNPRLFAEVRGTGPFRDRVAITGRADISPKGYGSVGVSCSEEPANPIKDVTDVAELHLTLQSASGKTLHAVLPVRVAPKPPEEGRRREPDVLRVRLADVRRVARAFPTDHGCVSAVITSPPYLDVTAFEEDQWLRLWFLGGPPRPTWGLYSRDDRHRSADLYWQFLMEAWAGISPLLKSTATIVCRVGSRRFSVAELEAKLRTSLRGVWSRVRLVDGPTISSLRKSRATLLHAGAKGCRFEMDIAYRVSNVREVTYGTE